MTDPDHTPPTAEPPPRRPHRRWLRFGMRTLLGLVLLVALALGWWVDGAHRQRRAVALIRAAYPDVVIHYDDLPIFEMSGMPYVRHPGPDQGRVRWFKGLVAWLDARPPKMRLPKDYLHSVRYVSMWEPQLVGPAPVSDIDAAQVVAAALSFDHLEWLRLNLPVRDEDLAGLGRLTDLRALFLPKPVGLTDAGFAPITALPNLRRLGVGDCPLTDAAIARLGSLSRLEDVTLGDRGEVLDGRARMQVTGVGLASLAGLPYLQALGVCSPRLNHEGIAQIAKLPHLERLGLFGPVAAGDLPLVASMPVLENVGLLGANLDALDLKALGRAPGPIRVGVLGPLRDDPDPPGFTRSGAPGGPQQAIFYVPGIGLDPYLCNKTGLQVERMSSASRPSRSQPAGPRPARGAR